MEKFSERLLKSPNVIKQNTQDKRHKKSVLNHGLWLTNDINLFVVMTNIYLSFCLMTYLQTKFTDPE